MIAKVLNMNEIKFNFLCKIQKKKNIKIDLSKYKEIKIKNFFLLYNENSFIIKKKKIMCYLEFEYLDSYFFDYNKNILGSLIKLNYVEYKFKKFFTLLINILLDLNLCIQVKDEIKRFKNYNRENFKYISGVNFEF